MAGVANLETSPLHAASSPSDRRTGSWVQVISHLDPRYGGVSKVLPELATAIAHAGEMSTCVAAFCHPDEHFVPEVAPGVSVRHFPASRFRWLKERNLKRDWNALLEPASGVHIHGLWEQSTAVASRGACKQGKPYIVSAHGMLESWALANKRVKKTLYLALMERANLERAACLHALTVAELQDYRRLGLQNPVAVIPNGVRIPERVSSTAFFERFPALEGKRLLLFLGRIHFKKGLDILSEAWSHLASDKPDVHLVLAGPDFENTLSQVKALVRERNLTERVTFTGMLAGELKWSALAAATCFVLPSYSEGLSVSVLEAMGMSVPVVITENCNLPEVHSFGCGRVVTAEADSLAAAIAEVLDTPSAALAGMGERGRQLVARNYSWESVGAQMSALYAWLVTGSPRPACVDPGVGRTRR
jgi:glycosyltransferase involved in cell wall biosynthesis